MPPHPTPHPPCHTPYATSSMPHPPWHTPHAPQPLPQPPCHSHHVKHVPCCTTPCHICHPLGPDVTKWHGPAAMHMTSTQKSTHVCPQAKHKVHAVSGCLLLAAGVRNTLSLGSSSTVGGSSTLGGSSGCCVRGFWRSDSQTHTADSDGRSMMSLDDMTDLAKALPVIEA